VAVNRFQSSLEGGGLPGRIQELTVDVKQAQLFADLNVDRGDAGQAVPRGQPRADESRKASLKRHQRGPIGEGLIDRLALHLRQNPLTSLDLGCQIAVGSGIRRQSIGPEGSHIIYFHNLSPDATMTKLIDMMIKLHRITIQIRPKSKDSPVLIP
jgi:hypothetical protein